MIAVLKKIALGLALIVVSAAILLYSDLPSRRVSAGPMHVQRQLRIAVVQHADLYSEALALRTDRFTRRPESHARKRRA